MPWCPPAGFRLTSVELAPGGMRPYEAGEWEGALVVVARGEVELECRDGGRRRFARGESLWLSGLPLRALHNPAGESTVLVAITRRR
jgi:hypothetical protein